MALFFGFAAAGIILIYLVTLFMSGNTAQLVRTLRWVLGGGAVAAAVLLGLTGRMGIASILGAAGLAVLMRGRLGPFDFTNGGPAPGGASKVRSRYFEMQLDHDNGDIDGQILTGQFRGQDLYDLGQEETGLLLAEVAHDSDSLALLEAWLDANRKGWRDYFEAYADGGSGADQGERQSGPAQPSRPMDAREAREVLGVSDSAAPEEIKAAHHRLLKAVHPDQGGSNYLAARINEAKDVLLKR